MWAWRGRKVSENECGFQEMAANGKLASALRFLRRADAALGFAVGASVASSSDSQSIIIEAPFQPPSISSLTPTFNKIVCR
jgi:hypothetical protein